MPDFPLQKIILLAVTAALLLSYGFVAYRRQAWKQLNATSLAVASFLLGSLAFWFSMFPTALNDEADPGAISGVGLGIAAALTTPGLAIALHRWRTIKARIVPYTLLGAFAFAIGGFSVWSQTPAAQSAGVNDIMRHGFAVVGLGLGGATVVLFAGAYFYLRFHTGNRMARLLAAGKHDEAIALGEAIPAAKRHPIVRGNLITAYSAAGRHDEALALAETIAADDRDPLMIITLASVCHAAGRSAEARTLIDQVEPQENWPQQTRDYVAKLRDDIAAATVKTAAP